MNSDILLFVKYLNENNIKVPKKLVINFLKSDKKFFFSMDDLLVLMSLESGFSQQQIGMRTRKRKVVETRQILMSLMHELTNASLSDVGQFLNPANPFDHATVLHAKRTVNDLRATNKPFRERMDNIYKSIDEIINTNKDDKSAATSN